MKRADLPLMLACTLIVWWLAACSSKAETSSGGSHDMVQTISHDGLTGRLAVAYFMVEGRYDFSTVYIKEGETRGDNWAEYYNGTIVVSKWVVDNLSTRKIACILVHELAHHNGGGEPEARAEAQQCLSTI